MNSWAYLAAHDVAGFVAGAYLVYTGHPGWAGLCFIMVATTTVRVSK